MSKAVAFSLFNYDGQLENWADFDTYCRGFFINCRINRVIYPEWLTVLNLDYETYHSPYKKLFDWLKANMAVEIIIRPSEHKLTRKMLWRAETAFTYTHPNWVYSHVLCRDCDSIGTYREVQAVTQWIQEDRAIHAITDSKSHDVALMGGMIGIRPNYINDRLKAGDNPKFIFDNLLKMAPDIKYELKGADQDFLNRVIYPKVQDSLTSHFVLGMRQVIKEGDGMHYSIPDIEIHVDPIHKHLNSCAGHIGAAGFYEGPMIQWLNKIDPFRDEYIEIQKQFPRLMFWQV